MILYTAPGSCGLASHIALEMSEATYEARTAPINGGKIAPSFYEINPKGRVPALVTSEGVLTETPAILFYIAQLHPQAQLAPFDDPWSLAQLQSFCAYLCSTVHVAHAHGYRGYRWATEESSFRDMSQMVPTTMTACFELIETEMLKGPWVLGSEFSLGDIYLLTMARWLEADQADTVKLPRVMEHRQRMLELAAVGKVVEHEKALASSM